MKIAILNASRELAEAFKWRHMKTVHVLNLAAPFNTGTVSYQFTGGSSERLWTFSDTIPSAANGRWMIRIGKNLWPLQRYLSPTTMQSPLSPNPEQDIASTGFELFQAFYLLPEQFMEMSFGFPQNSLVSSFLGGAEVTWLNHLSPTSGTPFGFDVTGDPVLPQNKAITFTSWPATAQTYAFQYRRFGRKVKYFGFLSRERSGTCSISGTTVTGVSTAFESGMEGSIIRLATDNTDYPTEEVGENPYGYEGVIDKVSSTTSLTVLSNTDGSTLTNVKYIISDPIDISPTMMTAFFRGVEAQSEIIRQREGSGKGDAMQLYQDALATAKSADRTHSIPEALIESWNITLGDLERNRQCLSDR
jgi:hypothetical protein